MVVLGSSSVWLRLLRAVECWLAVVSKDDADTPSLRGAILGAEGESDFTAGPVAPKNKSLGLRAGTGNFQRVTQGQGSESDQLEVLGDLGVPSVLPNSYTLKILCLTLPQHYHWLCKELQDLQMKCLPHTKQGKLLS